MLATLRIQTAKASATGDGASSPVDAGVEGNEASNSNSELE